jgi:hypothetical protein
MADDIATLGLAIDSSQTISASTALDKFSASGRAAQAQNEGLAKSQALVATATQRVNAETERVAGINLATSRAVQGLQSQMVAMAGGLGVVGVGLSALGPIGLVAAVGLAAVASAIQFVKEESLRMGQAAIGLRQFADVTGLSIAQIKALKEAGAELGLSGDAVASSFERLTGNFTATRQASGPLFDDIRNINGGLALQLNQAKTSAESINALARAYHEAGNEAVKANIAKAAFGRQGMAEGPILEKIFQAGGMENFANSMKGLSGATEQQTRAWADMAAKIEATEKRAKNILASIFTTEGLAAQLAAAQYMERMAIAAAEMARQKEGLSWLQRMFISLGELSIAEAGLDPEKVLGASTAMLAARQRLAQGLSENAGIKKEDVESWLKLSDAVRGILTPAEKATKDLLDLRNAAATAMNLQAARVGALGAAASIDEQTQQKLLKIESERLNSIFSLDKAENDALATRARSAAQTDARVQKEALRVTQLGELASVTELNRQKEDALAKSIRDGARFSDTELAAMRERNKLLTEASKIESQLVFDRSQIFKTQSDQSTDALLRANGIPPASDRAAAIRDYMRMTDTLKEVNSAAGTFASGFFTDLSHGVNATTALHNALTRLSDMLIDMAARRLVAQALGGLLPSLPGLPGGTIGGNAGSVVPVGHSGGILGRDVLPMRYIHPAYFEMAPRFAGGGIVGGERPVLAHDGEGIFTRGQMAAMGGNAAPPQVNVQVHNYTQANAQVQQSPSGDLHVVIRDAVRGTMIDDISNNGPVTRAHTQRFGLDPTRGMAV